MEKYYFGARKVSNTLFIIDETMTNKAGWAIVFCDWYRLSIIGLFAR
jgi:hypothetical protein